MKTKFKIIWIDDNYDDELMLSTTQRIATKIKRDKGFDVVNEDGFTSAKKDGHKSDFGKRIDKTIQELREHQDSSNNTDLIMIDYNLGAAFPDGSSLVKKFKASLPWTDIIFYSGKQTPAELRKIISDASIDGITCSARNSLGHDTPIAIANILHRTYRISNLRGMILSSVSEMDHLLKEIILKIHSNKSPAAKQILRQKIIKHVYGKTYRPNGLSKISEQELLEHERVTTGALHIFVKDNISDLKLTPLQKTTWDLFEDEVIRLRNTAAHAREQICPTKNKAAIFNVTKNKSYYRDDIDNICKILVKHECNILAIHKAFV